MEESKKGVVKQEIAIIHTINIGKVSMKKDLIISGISLKVR